MGVLSVNNLIIILSLLIIIIITTVTLGLITQGPTENEDIKQTACFRAASQGMCDELDERMGEGIKKYCCETYNKCC